MYTKFIFIFGVITALLQISQGFVSREKNHESQAEKGPISHRPQHNGEGRPNNSSGLNYTQEDKPFNLLQYSYKNFPITNFSEQHNHNIHTQIQEEDINLSPFKDNKCEAPNKEGLNGLIKEAVQQIPVKDILELSMKRIETDPEVKRLVKFLASEDLRNTLRSIKKSQKYIQFLEYVCKNLYLEMGNFWNLHNSIFHLQNYNSVQNVKESENVGVKGFFKDIADLLPIERFKEIFIRREKYDEYLRLAVDRLKSVQFRQKFNDVRYLPEYRHLVKKFIDLGVPLNEVITIVRQALGWAHTDISISDPSEPVTTA